MSIDVSLFGGPSDGIKTTSPAGDGCLVVARVDGEDVVVGSGVVE